jgi:hypothetical protein
MWTFRNPKQFFLLLFLSSCNVLLGQGEALVWPKDIVRPDYTITLYEPQNLSYLDNQLKSSLAFAYKAKGREPEFGMLWTTSLLDVDRVSRQASMVSVTIDEVRFSEELTADQTRKLEDLINEEVPGWALEFPLDDLLEDLEEVSVSSGVLENTPPAIRFATEPTVLIRIDGEPRLRAAEKGYELVENTGAFIARETKTNQFYLKGGEFWYASGAALGPWEPVSRVPSKIKAMAKKAEPEKKDGEDPVEDYGGPAPRIMVATEPTELIVFDGEPKYSPLQNTNLLYVENTESDIFMNVATQTYYTLISGRWFETRDLKGDWAYVPPSGLPEDFRAIAAESKKAGVLSHVAGTPEARNAVYDAQIPQTAAVSRDTRATEVRYNGNPEFQNIENLNLQYAVNTESSVFRDGNTYYLCDNAIWFRSSTPNGPWSVADQRPAEIDRIPANNPQFNTKYVYIYETSPTVVYVGHTPGYYGSYVYGPTVVYGTGFYYNPWYGGYYYHRPYTYGFSVRYNPWYGWSFGFGFGSPFMWYGHSYWGWGYHHWGPPFYRPPYYYRNRYSRPYHPIYRGRRGVTYYNRPAVRPNTRPSARPGSRPTTRPTTRPETRPTTRPTTRPETRPTTRPTTRPETRPTTRPTTRPETRPATRPTTPAGTRPAARPSTYPNTRPYSGSVKPVSRPAPRPSKRPVARPSGRSGGTGRTGN